MITQLETETGMRDSWNAETSGNPGVELFSNAIQVWALAQDRTVTLDEAASAFNVNSSLIKQAIDEHYWTFLSGNVIEHEGQ